MSDYPLHLLSEYAQNNLHVLQQVYPNALYLQQEEDSPVTILSLNPNKIAFDFHLVKVHKIEYMDCYDPFQNNL